MNRVTRNIFGYAAFLTPAAIALALHDWFSLDAAEPVGLWSGIAVIYLTALFIGFGASTLIEYIYIALFVSIGAAAVLSNESMAGWHYEAACYMAGGWFVVATWKLNRVFAEYDRAEMEKESDDREA